MPCRVSAAATAGREPHSTMLLSGQRLLGRCATAANTLTHTGSIVATPARSQMTASGCSCRYISRARWTLGAAARSRWPTSLTTMQSSRAECSMCMAVPPGASRATGPGSPPGDAMRSKRPDARSSWFGSSNSATFAGISSVPSRATDRPSVRLPHRSSKPAWLSARQSVARDSPHPNTSRGRRSGGPDQTVVLSVRPCPRGALPIGPQRSAAVSHGQQRSVPMPAEL